MTPQQREELIAELRFLGHCRGLPSARFSLAFLAAADALEDLTPPHTQIVRTVGMIVLAAGGSVRIPRSLQEELPRGELQRWDDPQNGDVIFTVTGVPR